MPEEEEEAGGYSFVDKRRVAEEPKSAPPAAPADPADSPIEDAAGTFEDFDERGMGLPQLNVFDRIFMSIDILHQGAWIALGLRADPATNEIQPDLEAARIAIDCVAFLASKIENQLDDATKREVKRIVSDLQLNYVNQAQRSQSSNGT